jgi:hypothetical protein
MILPVFFSLIQKNEKTALVKVSRGQRSPWRGLHVPTLEERRQMKVHSPPLPSASPAL